MDMRGDVMAGPQTMAADGSSFTSDRSPDEEDAPTRSKIWPVQLCCCLPEGVRNLIPLPWQVIYDMTHLCMVFGFASAILLLVLEVQRLLSLSGMLNPLLWWRPILILIATLPNLPYMIKTLSQYDDQLQDRQRKLDAHKKELTDAYENLVGAIEDLVGKATESSATMAERSFDSKRRDFQRFLERSPRNFGRVASTPEEKTQLLDQFKMFVQQWLTVFQECSVDPIAHPKIVVSKAEIDQCSSIEEVCSMVLERLKVTEVKFISAHRDEDLSMLDGIKRSPMLTNGMGMMMGAAAAVGSSFQSQSPRVEIEMTTSVYKPGADDETASQCSSFHGGLRPDMPPMSFKEEREERERSGQNQMCCGVPCTWCVVSCCKYGCACDTGQYPCVMQCKCVKAAILSRGHYWLMQGVVCLLLTMVAQSVASVLGQPVGLGFDLAIVLYFLCLMTLCVQFEQLDILQKMENDLKQLEADEEQIKARREETVAFWNSMQSLTDLWVHRTVPRLDLLKETQAHLEAAGPDEVISVMYNINRELGDLESKLPALENWSADGSLCEDAKKNFSEQVMGLCESQELPDLINGVRQLKGNLPAILADTAPSSPPTRMRRGMTAAILDSRPRAG